MHERTQWERARRIAAGSAIAVIVVMAGRAIANHDGLTIGACFSPNGKVKLAHAAGECDPSATFVSWNAQGPAGPQGAQGDIGPEGPAGPSGVANHVIVSRTVDFQTDPPPVDFTFSLSVLCPDGFRVVGGGGQLLAGQAANVALNSSHPDTPVTPTLDSTQMRRWLVVWRTVDGSPFPVDQVVLARVFATCVQVE